MNQLVLKNLISHGWQDLEFEPFREGVEIYWINHASPQIALLKYEPGASVPRHRHMGLETIIILEGDQIDDNGKAEMGDVVVNEVGSEHAVRSETGCVVLIQWELPVLFL